MEYSKENIITEYKKLKTHLGKPPSAAKFYSETGISQHYMEKVYGSNAYSKLVIECGDTPNNFSSQKSDLKEILLQWGALARKCQKIPARADWLHNNCKPSENAIRTSHGLNWTDLPYKFFEYYSDNNEWSDVIALIPERAGKIPITSLPKIEGLEYKYIKFIPPVVQDMIALSYNEEKSKEFEEGVNRIFRMLGFEVEEYGQGTGRNPDGIAKENQHRYAILLDAKTRKDGYKIGTDDRTIIEYINRYKEQLHKTGFQTIYFLIISSSFIPTTSSALKTIKVDTNISTTLISIHSLLKLLSRKIENPRLFDLKQFQELLIEPGEIDDKVDRLLKKIK